MHARWLKSLFAAGLLVAGAAQAAVVSTSDMTYGVFDGSSGTRTLNVTQRGTIEDVNITIDFSKCDDPPIGPLGTTCVGSGDAFEREIVFQLTSADGTTVDLVRFGTYTNQARGAGRVSVTFDDEATTDVGGAVRSGTFRPAGSLAAFDGVDLFGNWSLFVRDTGRGDPLEYFSSRLDITYAATAEPAPVPEPASLATLGLGLLGLGAARRRKQV